MVRIVGDILLDHVDKTSNKFRLASDFVVYVDKYRIQAFRGFMTDGASIPRPFWCFAPPVAGKYLEAAIIHDLLYATHVLDRKTADKIFLELMIYLGVRKIKARVMYRIVRMFGQGHWNRGFSIENLRFVKLDIIRVNTTKG